MQGGPIILGDMGWPLMGDREWIAASLQSRLLHPELYEGRENVGAVMAKLRRQLAAYDRREGNA